MPKIQEYLPEVDATGPVGQTSPMLEQVQAAGRGEADFGRQVTEGLNVMRQRQGAAESADAYAAVADKRSEMLQNIEQMRNDGTLDDDALEKVKSDYQDWTEKQADQYDTSIGKNAFVRSSSRAQGMILTNAARARAQVAGNEAKENLNNVMNQNSNLVMQDPSQFDNVRDSQREMIQDQVDSGVLSPNDARVAKQRMDEELYKGAFNGHMQTDYNAIKAEVIASGGKVDPNDPANPNFNNARAWLMADKNNDMVNASQKEAMLKQIGVNNSAAQVAGMQAIAQKTNLENVQAEKLRVDFNSQLLDNRLSPDDVTKAAKAGILTADDQLKYYHLIQQAGKEEMTTSPAIKNDVMSRVLLPDNDPKKISSSSQIAYMVKDGSLSMKDFMDVDKAIRAVPDNRANTQAEAELMKVAKQRIGNTDPDSEYKLMLFNNEIQQAKQNAQKTQQPVGPLFDPNSNQFLGNKIQHYVATPQESLRARAQIAAGIRTGNASSVTVQPGVIPTPAKPAPGPGVWDTVKGWFGGSTPPAVKPEDISAMPRDQLMKLDPKSLSPVQKAAAAARFRELKQKAGSQ